LGFERVPLGELVHLKRGYDLPARTRRAGTVPVVSSRGFTGTHDVARVSAPGVVTGRTGTLGGVFFLERDFWPLNTTLYVDAAFDMVVDPVGSFVVHRRGAEDLLPPSVLGERQ